MVGMSVSEEMDERRLAGVGIELARVVAAVESVDSNPRELLNCKNKTVSLLIAGSDTEYYSL